LVLLALSSRTCYDFVESRTIARYSRRGHSRCGTLLVADIIARLALTAAELPIGVVTATLGAPVFIWLLLKAGR
jgi:ABC-type cobalamin transport system permease subunit